MRYIENDSIDPYFNLALEEYLLGFGIKEDVLLLWQNDSAVVVGRYQNTLQEINEQFCREHSIRIVRRNTGGGAVYHDLGNLNFSIITDYTQGDDITFGRFLRVICDALRKLGVNAELQGRNDLVVGGLKISGSAQTIHGNRILHHGTLLCCTDLYMLSGALQNDLSKFASKSTASVKSRVANIKDINAAVSVDSLKNSIISEFGSSAPLERQALTEAASDAVRLLRDNKYDTWQWNYGESPDFNFEKKTRFPHGMITVNLIVEEGIISKCAITGDFLGCMDICDIEKSLVGTRQLYYDVAACISRFDTSLYFGGIPSEDVAGCFFC